VERRESAPQGRPSGNHGRGRRDANANAPDRQERTRPRPAPSSPASRRGGSRLACHPHLIPPFAWLYKYAPAAQHAPLPSLPSRSPPPPPPAFAPRRLVPARRREVTPPRLAVTLALSSSAFRDCWGRQFGRFVRPVISGSTLRRRAAGFQRRDACRARFAFTIVGFRPGSFSHRADSSRPVKHLLAFFRDGFWDGSFSGFPAPTPMGLHAAAT
jgi:hypothetical protein